MVVSFPINSRSPLYGKFCQCACTGSMAQDSLSTATAARHIRFYKILQNAIARA
jgi:hypothetical protein